MFISRTRTALVVIGASAILAGAAACSSESSDGAAGAGGTSGTAGAPASGGASGEAGATASGGAAGAGGDTSTVPGKTIRGTVSYAGSQQGSLSVGLYTQCPPAGPPVDLKIQKFAAPAFPQAYELTGVKAGSYYTIAVLDIGSNNPMMPGDEDLMNCSEQVSVSDAEGAAADITVLDK